mmetsp:Transcript_13079/g.38284  ORF Transcript_13079/g.38284 Transcript_13079/m.38284 type:complete len:208 (+) Transcript_13079:1029-1652(+)
MDVGRGAGGRGASESWRLSAAASEVLRARVSSPWTRCCARAPPPPPVRPEAARGSCCSAVLSAGSCSASASRLIAAAVDLPPSDECGAPSTRNSAALACPPQRASRRRSCSTRRGRSRPCSRRASHFERVFGPAVCNICVARGSLWHDGGWLGPTGLAHRRQGVLGWLGPPCSGVGRRWMPLWLEFPRVPDRSGVPPEACLRLPQVW